MEERVEEVKANLGVLEQRISNACSASGRSRESVRLIWVSKTRPIEDVHAAIAAGAVDFGENRVQEAVQKFTEPLLSPFNTPAGSKVRCHLIGPVQANKLRKAAAVADCIHSIDQMDHIRKLQAICIELNRQLEVLVQVNTSAEESKSGLQPSDAEPFLRELYTLQCKGELDRLHFRGLMTIGVNSGNPEDSRQGFRWLRGLRDTAHAWGGPQTNPWSDSRANPWSGFTELSMGMTDDLEVAIAEGSTMVRIGTALFGKRATL